MPRGSFSFPAFVFKGYVDYIDELPEKPEQGDMYCVKFTGQSIDKSELMAYKLYAYINKIWCDMEYEKVELNPEVGETNGDG